MYKRKVDNIWDHDLVDFVDIHLITKFNKGFQFLLFPVDIYSKYLWVVPLKYQKSNKLIMLFKKSEMSLINGKPNKI